MKLRLTSVVLMACLTGLCHYHSAAQNNVAAIQYYFNTDPGVGAAGNGGIIAITPTADFNQTIAITVPNTIPNGFNNLYIRAMDESGRWSLNERRVLMIKTLNATADVTAYQYYFDTDPGVGVAGNGAVVPITATADFNQTVAITVPNSLSAGFHNLYVRTKDSQGRWSLNERRMFMIKTLNTTADVTAYQYYFDTDPGVGVAGNGAVVPITATADFNQTVAITVPNTLTSGFHNLYVRTKDTQGRWSLNERRMFMIKTLNTTADVTAYQYYFDTDPGVGVAGNGAVATITPTADFNQTVAITVPNSLSAGFHNLYVRTKDTQGRWSLNERRMFMIKTQNTTADVTAYQYYFDTDPGVDMAGNGAVIPITATADFNQTVAIMVPNTLTAGFHNLYVRTKDTQGRWSLNERRMFMIKTVTVTENVMAMEYYFDNDPGPGNGNIYPITPGSAINITATIAAPCLSTGIHYLYVRAKNSSGQWSIIDRDTVSITSGVAASVITPSGPLTICSGDSTLLAINQIAGATYQWQLNNVDIAGETGTQYDANTAGNYSVKVTCGSSFSTSNTVVVTSLPLLTFYADADGDSYGDPALIITGCSQPTGYVTNNTDCNDANQNIHPGMTEICNGIDDNCNTLVDDGLTFLTYYTDADNDGYGDPLDPGTSSCDAVSGKVTNNADCNDANANVNPAATEVCNGIDDDCDSQIDEGVTTTYYADVDGDGYGNVSSSVQACTQPVGYVTITGDCNDNNATVNPGATEVCNGIDDDCDSQVDEGVTSAYYADADGDGYGNPASSVQACTQPPAYVTDNTDCDDGNVLIHSPVEYYVDADGDGYGSTSSSWICSLTPPAGYASNHTDCNDSNSNIHPGATEICNGIDDDCNTLADDADPGVTGQPLWYVDADGDGFGSSATTINTCVQPSGYVSNDNDCDDSDNAIHAPIQYYVDMDGDGYGSPVTAMLCSLTAPAGYSTNNQDCNDGNSSVNPGAAEACNGVDDNCNTFVDDGFPTSTAASAVNSSNGTSFCASSGTALSVSGGSLAPGASWIWYEGGCGTGASVGSGSSITITPIAGSYTYYVRAEGTCDLSACVSISLTVTDVPAFLSCPGTLSVNTTAGQCSAPVSYSVAASGSPVFAYSFTGATTGTGSGTGSGAVFNQGTTTVTITATNTCGTDQCSFDITVNDSEDPFITGCPSNITQVVDEGQWGAAVTWTAPTAGDHCGMGTLTGSHTPGAFFNVGTTLVTYTATDIHGNSAQCQFQVTITPPNLIGKVNVALFSADITISNENPDPSSAVNVSAVIHNNSGVDATSFMVRLLDQYTNAVYPLITVPSLGASQSVQVNWVVNTPPVSAFVPLQVTIDLNDDLDESSEADNAAIKSYICGTPASLGTMAIGTNPVPASTIAGSVIQICGSAYYENVIPPLADSSVAGADVSITIIETGQVFTGYTDEDGNFCISYTTPNTPGLYHYDVEISDNTLGGDASGSFLLTAPPAPVCHLDLSVSMELTGIMPTANNYYTVTVGTVFGGVVHVHNGCQQVTQSTTLFISLPNGTPVPGPFVVPPLLPGQTYDVTLPSMTLTLAGMGYISATVDYYNVVVESNESNNTAYKTLNILPLLPDLAVIGGGVLSPRQCQPANQVMFTVKNYGPVASGSFNAVFEFYENNLLQTTLTQIIANLDPDEDTLLVFPFIPALLTDSFELTVDTPNVVVELSELNNRLSFPYTFQTCMPDIQVLGCEYSDVKPADPAPSSSLTVTAQVKNASLLQISTPFVVQFDVAGNTTNVTVPGPLAPGQTVNLTATAPAPAVPGSSVTVTADITNQVTEGNEANNSFGAPLCYEFHFTNIDCFGYPIWNGTQHYCNPANFHLGLWNVGVYESSNLQVQYEISGPGLTGWVVLGNDVQYMNNSCNCPSGTTYPNTFYYPQTGIYQIRMTIDPLNIYAECDESNNQVIMSVNVMESVDYKVLSSFINPSEINPDINESISFSVSYQNDGCAGFSPLELYGQVDNTPLDSVMVAPLNANGMGTVALTNTWSSAVPGIHVFRAIIDNDNQFAESNEMNNEATKAIIVGEAPDYHVLNISVNDNTPSMGQLLQITTDVHNDGQSTGNGVLQFLYTDGINGEILISQQTISILQGTTITESISWIAVNPDARLIARVINVMPLELDLSDNEQQLQLNNITVSLTATNALCFGANSGTITVNITGGVAPYAVTWSVPGFSGNTINVPAGTYSVFVTDYNGTTGSASATVAQPTAVSVQATASQILCNGDLASVTVTATGGTLPYSGTGNFTTVAGSINYVVTDMNGCVASTTVIITEPTLLSLSETHSAATCSNLSDGNIDLSVVGGVVPYLYSWSNATTSQDLTNLSAGVYTVSVTDDNGCTESLSVTILNQNTATVWYADADGDTYGNPASSVQACMQPTGYVANDDDCNDTNANINPAATEICNGMDDDCDGLTDDADPSVIGQSTWYADADGDTYGTSTSSVQACNQPSGYVSNDDDCNDANANVNPVATEICNGMDDDCDGLTDDADPSVIGQSTWYADADGDGYGTSTSSIQACNQPVGYVANDDDCNDANANVHPAATEICSNGIDDNCNGIVDENCNSYTWYADSDNDGYGDVGNSTTTSSPTPPSGYVADNTDCNDQNAAIHPGATEICNGIDDNCNGLVDDGLPNYLYYADADGDGYGNPMGGLMICNTTPPTGYVLNHSDCNDANSNISPTATEVCGNGIDDNCNGLTDENCGCVGNTAPVVNSITASPDMIAQGTSTTLTTTFTDNTNVGPYEVRFNWNDGTAQTIISVPQNATGTYSVSASHTYNASAVFEPNVRVYDSCGAVSAQVSSVSTVQYLVVYVTGNQFTTMGGWFNTPAGSYMADPSFTGKVNMGNVVKPLSGAFKGELELNINDKSFKVHAVNPTTWDYLAISGCCFAQFRGACKINNVTGYKVLVAQTDHNYSCGQFGGNDMIRVKVWNQTTGQVIYDTQPGDPDNATPTTPLNGGSIKVHTQNSCVARPMEISFQVDLYPNPADAVLNFNITSDQDQEIEVRMIDITGRLVYLLPLKGIRGSNSGTIQTGDMKRGIYFIEIHYDSDVIREKVVLN